MSNRFWLLLAVATSLATLSGTLSAQDSHLTVVASAAPTTVKPGDEVVLSVDLTIEPGWHVYGSLDPEPETRTRLVLPPVTGLEPIGEAEVPAGVPHEKFGMTNYWVEGGAVLRQRFKVTPEAVDGELTLAGAVSYMACTPEMCDEPTQAPFAAKVTVQGGKAPQQPGVTEWIGKKSTDKVRFRARLEPPVLRPGERGRLVVEVEIAPRWHVYGSGDFQNTPTELVGVKAGGGVHAVGSAEVPMGEQHGSGTGEMWVIEDEFEVTQAVVVTPDAAPGARELRADFAYQTCDDSGCLAPTSKGFSLTYEVAPGEARTEFAATPAELAEASAAAAAAGGSGAGGSGAGGSGAGGAGAAATGGNDAAVTPAAGGTGAVVGRTGYAGGAPFDEPPRMLEPKFAGVQEDMSSLWQLILLCIGGGLIALIMPCTYPMIPITFSFFTKQAERRGGNVLSLALVYGMGIVVIFMLIGLFVGPIIINFAAHWATNLVIGLAFLFFAAALFGWVNLQPPAFLTRASGKASAQGGLVGVFLMGATLVVTSFTCTAPIVGSLLAGAATGHIGKLDLAIGMGAFGLTMATPFVFLALLPGRVKALPKSGDWMHTLKVSLGFVEVAAALKFLSNFELALNWKVLPRELFLGIWALVFVLLALFLFGLFRGRGQPLTGVSPTSNGFAIVALSFSMFCVGGMSGLPLGSVMTAFEPPYQLREVEEHDIVKDDHDAAVAEAIEAKKYLLINFTGFA